MDPRPHTLTNDETEYRMQRRAYIDPETAEISLMVWDDLRAGWVPHVRTMESWRASTVRLYQTTDTARIISMPGHKVWEFMTDDESYDIRAQIQHPWIPDGSAIEIPESDIAAMETLMMTGNDGGAESQQSPQSSPPSPPAVTALAALAWALPEALAPPARAPGPSRVHRYHHTTDALWDLMRPALVWDAVDPWIVASVDPRVRPVDLLTLALAASMAEDPAATAATAATATAPQPFPKHLTDMVLQKAEADAAICPITMDPIKAAEAAVTSCGHIFQAAAIREWLTAHATCPECRQPCSV